MMLKAIDRRLHNQYALEASLHGYKIPFRFNRDLEIAKQESVEEKFDTDLVEKAMIDAQKRVKARYV